MLVCFSMVQYLYICKLSWAFFPDNIDALGKVGFCFFRWEPIDKLAWLGVPSLLLHIIVLSYDWSSVGREDTVRSALDILSVCAILPRVQVALCENVSFPGEKTKGM
jgi:HIV-1 Vpr-binding protein